MKITLNHPKSAAMGFYAKGLKKEFEAAVVNEPSMFEPLKFYCIFLRRTKGQKQLVWHRLSLSFAVFFNLRWFETGIYWQRENKWKFINSLADLDGNR